MNIEELIEELCCIQRTIIYGQSKLDLDQKNIHRDFKKSALNLFHYLVLRSFDLRPLQDILSELGLSSLRTGEGYVLQNLNNVVHHLKLFSADSAPQTYQDIEPLGYRESRNLLRANTNRLFSGSEKHNKTNIMVTLPTDAAFDQDMVYKMAINGMDIARINLGHDDKTVWEGMVNNIKSTSLKIGRSIKIYLDLAGPKIRTAAFLQHNKKGKPVKKISLKTGQRLILTKTPITDSSAKFLETEEHSKTPVLNVSLPQIIDDLALNHEVLFDDGMIRSHVIAKTKNSATLEITKCFKRKLGHQKGINLPNTKLNLPALTSDDISVLPFACGHADILGYSFVRSENDVAELYNQLNLNSAKDIGVVFKIENQEAFENFPDILLKGMERNKIGIMIARGDLAVELGFERISEVQKELLWLCEAAHVPVIWATQVLETLAKKGIPTRAEISDAAQGARAECVMLNKGSHINQAIETLRNILDKMDGHMSKKKDSLRALGISKKYMEWQDQSTN